MDGRPFPPPPPVIVMCGIIGYTGPRPVVPTLLKGLSSLEYRGYDSAGMSLVHDKGIHTVRTVGPIVRLEAEVDAQGLREKTWAFGVAHTRWATHGAPSVINAHPQLSNDGTISVVHNGIIENKEELKAELINMGYQFTSQTDTEVLPILLEHYAKTADTFFDAIVKTMTKVIGAFALAILRKGDPEIYGTCVGSPLCVGIGEGENFLASDASAFVEYTHRAITLKDREIVAISPTNHRIQRVFFSPTDAPPDVVAKKTDHRIVDVPFDIEQVRKGKYAHFMLKEINEQAMAVANTISGKVDHLDDIHIDIPPCLQSILILACGTSHYAGGVGEYIINNTVGIPVFNEYASEFINKRCFLGPQNLVLAISQSGETADTRDALLKAKETGASVAGVINVVGSQIARIAGRGMYLHAGPEIGVASTKAFTCQVAAMNLLAAFLSRDRQFRREITDGLRKVPEAIREVLQDTETMETIAKIAETFHTATNALYLGRGLDYPVSLEGALKLKEISYIHAEGYPAGEMKHGPIALIDHSMPCFFILGPEESIYRKVLSNMEEVNSRRGRIITITSTPKGLDKRVIELSEFLIHVPHVSLACDPIIKAVPLQLIAYMIAVKKGLDPDKPRNLAKSVTVH